jgi:hypothetical protein
LGNFIRLCPGAAVIRSLFPALPITRGGGLLYSYEAQGADDMTETTATWPRTTGEGIPSPAADGHAAFASWAGAAHDWVTNPWTPWSQRLGPRLMRLHVPFPQGWAVTTRDRFVRAVAPSTSGALTVEVGPLHQAAIVDDTIADDLPIGAELRLTRRVDLRSACGWPVSVIRASVVHGGAIVEERIGAFYRFGDGVAPVLVRGRDPEVWNRFVGELDAFILAADFVEGAGPSCLADVLCLGGGAQ